MVTVDIAVAISTTGDEHRLDLLARSIASWRTVLAMKNGGTSEGTHLFVTIDGDEEAVTRVVAAVGYEPVQFYRVGQPHVYGPTLVPDRMGVAVNKNTGLELLMGNTPAQHLFLSDDDTWPLYPQSLDKHIDLATPHSMVCWGKNRLDQLHRAVATWNWPRGVMLYATREIVRRVGGMDERFGPGGHEHVEWSNRIHNSGMSPAPFCSPASYATRHAMGARALWHAEDMRRDGESISRFVCRKRAQTSIKTTTEDWKRIDEIMAEHEGDSSYIPYQATYNGRASATLCPAPRA